MITLDRDILNVAVNLPSLRDVDNGPDGCADLSQFDQEGFRFLGAGCERTVWLGPDGMVYKIENGRDGANWEEWRKSILLRSDSSLPDWVYIPECELDADTTILVTEYMKGYQPWDCYYGNGCFCVGDCRWSAASEAFDLIGSYDGHAGNCVIIECDSEEEFVVALVDFTR